MFIEAEGNCGERVSVGANGDRGHDPAVRARGCHQKVATELCAELAWKITHVQRRHMRF